MDHEKWYPAEQRADGKWVVKMEMVDGTTKENVFDSKVDGEKFIQDELINYSETGLTHSQQEYVLMAWDKMNFDELTRTTFNLPLIDGRSKQGRLIKKFLTSRQLTPKPSYKARVPELLLDDKQKESIKALAATHSSLEIARELFGKAIPQLSREHRAVDGYVRQLPVEIRGERKQFQLAVGEYSPPKSLSGAIQRFNKFNHLQIDPNKLAPTQKKGVEALVSHLNSPRFTRTCNAFSEEQDRDSFESEFIRHVWDKPDLGAEELNLYINLCADYIMMFKIQAQIEALDGRLRDVVSDPAGEITMRLTEAISVKTKEYDSCFERHRKLADDLAGKRSKRLDKNIRDNATVLSLVQAWKNEEDRRLWILNAQAKELEASNEITRLETIDELKARILGIGKNEALHGL